MNFRHMTSLYIVDGGQILLLYRIGSRVLERPMWCGIGGHMEEVDEGDPTVCLLRELEEETGLTAGDLDNLRLRYISLRQIPGEIRQNYYYFATPVKPIDPLPSCDEGILKWVPLEEVPALPMPKTAQACLSHFFREGQLNERLYLGAISENREKINFTELVMDS